MNLEELKVIDGLLEDRAYLMACLEDFKISEFRCVSVKASHRLSCRSKIYTLAKGLQYDMAIGVYNLLVEELNELNDKLKEHGVETYDRKFFSGEKQLMAEGLIADLENNDDSVEEGGVHIGQVMPTSDEFAMNLDQYKFSK